MSEDYPGFRFVPHARTSADSFYDIVVDGNVVDVLMIPGAWLFGWCRGGDYLLRRLNETANNTCERIWSRWLAL